MAEAQKHLLVSLAEEHQARLKQVQLDTHYDYMMANQLFVDLTEPDNPRVVQPEAWSGESGSGDVLVTLKDGSHEEVLRKNTRSLVKRILVDDEKVLLRQFVGDDSKISLEPRYSRCPQ